MSNREVITLPEQRESNLSGFAEAISSGANMGTQIRNAKTAERNARTYEDQVKGQTVDREYKRAELLYNIAKMNTEQQSNEQKSTLGLLEKLGQYFGSDEKKAEYDNWLSSEGGKAFTKKLKSTLPEMIGADGKPILIKPETQMKNKLEDMKAQLLEKIANGTATPEQREAAQMLTKYPPDEIANAAKAVINSPGFAMLPDDKKAAYMANALETYKSGVDKYRNMPTPQPSASGNDEDLSTFLGKF